MLFIVSVFPPSHQWTWVKLVINHISYTACAHGGALTWCVTHSRDVPEFQTHSWPLEFIANALSKWFFSNLWLHYLSVSFRLQSSFCFVPAGLVQSLVCGSGAQPVLIQQELCEGSWAPFVPLWTCPAELWSALCSPEAALGAAVPVLL